MDALVIPFLTILVAELLDKSQLAILLISPRIKNHLLLFLGVMVGFAVVDGSAILLGSWIPSLLPPHIITVISGVLFILFGVLSLLSKDDDQINETGFKKNAVFAGFLIIFLSEWGDKTQIASAVFATQYAALSVFVGVMAAQALLALAAIFIGQLLLKKIKKQLLTRIAGIVFILLGVFFLLF